MYCVKKDIFILLKSTKNRIYRTIMHYIESTITIFSTNKDNYVISIYTKKVF